MSASIGKVFHRLAGLPLMYISCCQNKAADPAGISWSTQLWSSAAVIADGRSFTWRDRGKVVSFPLIPSEPPWFSHHISWIGGNLSKMGRSHKYFLALWLGVTSNITNYTRIWDRKKARKNYKNISKGHSEELKLYLGQLRAYFRMSEGQFEAI